MLLTIPDGNITTIIEQHPAFVQAVTAWQADFALLRKRTVAITQHIKSLTLKIERQILSELPPAMQKRIGLRLVNHKHGKNGHLLFLEILSSPDAKTPLFSAKVGFDGSPAVFNARNILSDNGNDRGMNIDCNVLGPDFFFVAGQACCLFIKATQPGESDSLADDIHTLASLIAADDSMRTDFFRSETRFGLQALQAFRDSHDLVTEQVLSQLLLAPPGQTLRFIRLTAAESSLFSVCSEVKFKAEPFVITTLEKGEGPVLVDTHLHGYCRHMADMLKRINRARDQGAPLPHDASMNMQCWVIVDDHTDLSLLNTKPQTINTPTT